MKTSTGTAFLPKCSNISRDSLFLQIFKGIFSPVTIDMLFKRTTLLHSHLRFRLKSIDEAMQGCQANSPRIVSRIGADTLVQIHFIPNPGINRWYVELFLG